jgi:hypothetical protein
MQLLVGEPQTSAESDDIVHWRDVYAELTNFLQLTFAGLQPGAAHAGRVKDMLNGMVERHSFWSRRGEELGSPPSMWSPN